MCCLVYLRLPTVCFVGDVIIGACAHLVGNTIICNTLLTICESASWYGVVSGSVQCTGYVHCCDARVCICNSRVTNEGLKTANKTGAFRTKVVCVCVCVGSSDLATVLIMWVSCGVITAI